MTSDGEVVEDLDFDDPIRKSARLERQLDRTLRYGDRLNQALYRQMNADLQAANRRADRAEAELAALRASTTYRVGRAILAVPARARRRLRPGTDS
jgi:hypothetical protein